MLAPMLRGSTKLGTLSLYARLVVLVLLLVGAAAVLANGVDRFTPVRTWLIWRLMVIWGWQVLFVGGCLSLGYLVCSRLMRAYDELPALELTTLAMATGVVGFVFAIYIVGTLRLLGPTTAVLIPLAMLAAGARFSPLPGRMLGLLHAWRPRLGPAQIAVLAFGLAGIAAVYLHVIDPGAPNHDALWTHVVIAQDIGREGRIVPFPADWAKNFPHLASMVYAWSFLVPWLGVSMRMLLVLHTEFVLLLFTLASIVAGVRWLLGSRTGYGLAWVGFFLFANIVLYDSDLGASADHVAAFFMLPMCLTVARAIERPQRRWAWILGGLLMGAILITKLQSAYVAMILCALITLVTGVRAVRGLLQGKGPAGVRGALAGPVTLAAFTMLGASPHLIESTVFYHNPIYPFRQDIFKHSTPTLPDAPTLVNKVLTGDNRHRPTGETRLLRIKEGLGLVLTFAFEPHYSFRGDRPTFGFLFTLLSPLVLLLPRTRRLKLGALVGTAAVFAWAMTYQIDRNLQIVLPVLAAVTVGTMERVWSSGWLARLALALPVLLQVAWNAEYLYEPIQPLLARARVGAAVLADGEGIRTRREIAQHLPESAVVLMHTQHVTLGLDRKVLHDTGGFQGLIDQRPLHTARALYDRLHEIGVTHLVWLWNVSASSRQEAVVFNLFVTLDAVRMGNFGGNELAAMPETPPPVERPYRTLVLGVAPYGDGIYTTDQLSMFDAMPLPTVPEPLVRRDSVADANLEQLLTDTDVVMFSSDHGDAWSLYSLLARDFEPVPMSPPWRLFFNHSLREARASR